MVKADTFWLGRPALKFYLHSLLLTAHKPVLLVSQDDVKCASAAPDKRRTETKTDAAFLIRMLLLKRSNCIQVLVCFTNH